MIRASFLWFDSRFVLKSDFGIGVLVVTWVWVRVRFIGPGLR